MALKMIGKVFSIGATQVINSKNGGQPFSKREIILDEDLLLKGLLVIYEKNKNSI